MAQQPSPSLPPPTPAEAATDPLAGLRPLGPEGFADGWARWCDRALRSPARALALALVVVLVAAVAWWLVRPPPPPLESTLPRSVAAPAGAPGRSGSEAGAGSAGPGGSPVAGGAASSTSGADVVVQASGAVARPGVYPLPVGARVDDLVRAAGGLTPDADADRVNLAAPVADGERVWLPRRGEADPPPLVAGSSGGARVDPAPGAPGSGGAGATAEPTVIDLNTADADQLDTLPGVGPATAAAILAYRDQHGPFTTVDDLLEVRGIGDAKLEQLRPLVTV